jgi:hypothetical protein
LYRERIEHNPTSPLFKIFSSQQLVQIHDQIINAPETTRLSHLSCLPPTPKQSRRSTYFDPFTR